MTLMKEAMKKPRNSELKKTPYDEYEGEELEDHDCGLPMLSPKKGKAGELKDFIEVIIKIGK
jgi:hypothetical protein